MDLTISNIAKSLKMSAESLAKQLEAEGMIVDNYYNALSEEQLRDLKRIIDKSKMGVNSKVEIEEKAKKYLEKIVKEKKIFIDTCSLMQDEFEEFEKKLSPLLIKENKQVIIPYRVLEEVKKHCKSPEDNSERRRKAINAYNILKKMNAKNLIDVRGEDSDNFADNVFTSVFMKHRLKHKLLLITQDKSLAQDILGLNEMKSDKGYYVDAKRINTHAYISGFNFDNNNNDKSNKKKIVPKREEVDEEVEIEKFRLPKEVTKLKNEKICVSSIPSEGDYVICGNKKVRLIKCFASGGEGCVYETDTPYVCKIYKKDKIDTIKFEKIKLMISKKVDHEGVCWPVEMVYNLEKEFVGYIMPKAKGKELQRCLFIKPLLQKNFPTWKKRDTVELCVTILEKIKYLHERNIILGDINPMNILVVSSKEVYFVDTDSYQIEDFPCPVGTVNFTAPEIQGKRYETFLRSFGNEYFAVATLLFMIMLPGKSPYAQQGGENPVDNIIKMNFSYPYGDQSNKKAPDGPWRFMWSHLTYDIKGYFYKTFRKGEERSSEDTRVTTNEWYGKMKYYLKLLDEGKLEEKDSMSIELFPTRYKKSDKLVYVKCTLCNNEVPESFTEQGICRNCLSLKEVYNCQRCGKEMHYSNYDKYIRNSKKYDTCMECCEYFNKAYATQRCSDCGNMFEITNRERDYYKSKNWNLPKKCKACRKKSNTSQQFKANYNKKAKEEPIQSMWSNLINNIKEYFH